jgi:DNA-binding CsgD family transcriptional regulator
MADESYDEMERDPAIRVLLLLTGFTGFLTCLYLRLFFPSMSLSAPGGQLTADITYLVGLGGFLAVVACSRLFANSKRKIFPNRYLCGLLVVVAVASAALALLPQGALLRPLCHLLDFALFCGLGYLLVSWIVLLSANVTIYLAYYLATVAAVAALLGFLVSTFSHPFVILAFGVLYCLSALLLSFCHLTEPPQEHISIEVSKKRRSLSKRTTFSIMLYGVVFGMAAYFLAYLGAQAEGTIGLIGGIALCALSIHHDNGINGEKNRRRVVIVIITCLLLVYLVPPAFQRVLWAILIGLFILYLLFHWDWVLVTSSRSRLNVVFHFSQSEWALWAGLLMGWAFGWSSIVFSIELVYFCTALVLATAFITLTYVYDDFENLKLLAFKESASPVRGDERYASRFFNRCQAVAKVYNLTLRETEVLIMLAKGRNAKYIQSELVISNHTAKTHIHNIYKKMSITSQQSLIDIVDKVNIED